jgi:hypothetical protein
VNSLSTLTLFMLTLPLGTVSPPVVSSTLSSLSIDPLVSTGCLVSRICRAPRFSVLFVYFGQTQVLMLGVFGAIVTLNFLGRRFGNTLLTMPPTSLLRPRAVSLPTSLWSLTGKSWFTWPAPTSQKNKCPGRSGSMQLFTRHG